MKRLALFCAIALITVALAGVSATRSDATGPPIGGAGSVFYLNDAFSGSASTVFGISVPPGAEVYVGDWNGAGRDTLMIRQGATFSVYGANRSDAEVRRFIYGNPGDLILVGDWDGDGRDSLAVRRGATYHLTNAWAGGIAEQVVQYGNANDITLIGDWDGDGRDTFAVRRGAEFHVRNSLTSGVAEAVAHFGNVGDQIVVGDWDGDGRDSLGVVRDATFYLRNSLSSGVADTTLRYGDAGDVFFVGDWNGDGRTTVGVRRTCFSGPGIYCPRQDTIAEMLQRVNAERASVGVAPLQLHAGLGALAQSWSSSMASRQDMTHSTTFCDQTIAMGFRRCAENIARTGAPSATGVMNVWMNSAGHRANILNPNLTHIGVGVSQAPNGSWYWTQNFGG